MSESSQSQSWWHTVPGMLTGAAAIITALTGLFVALQQSGWLRRDSAVPHASIETVPAAGRPGPVSAVAASALTPELSDVTLGSATYSVVALQTEVRTTRESGLRVTVRVSNRGNYPLNFWNASFRLLADGLLLSPVGDLNKIVQGNSAEQGDVEFVYPASATDLVLRIMLNEENADIRLVSAQAQQ